MIESSISTRNTTRLINRLSNYLDDKVAPHYSNTWSNEFDSIYGLEFL